MPNTKTEEEARDNTGRFIKNLIAKNTAVSKTTEEDTLIDVHVGNPLHKIIELLKDLKKQKAFSFSLKGSLGIAGVVVVIAGAGVLGGMQSLCNKGIQSQIGQVRILSFEETNNTIDRPIVNKIKEFLGRPVPTSAPTKRTILIKSDYSVIHLVAPTNLSLLEFTNIPVIATGNYDSCLEILTLKDKSSIEPLK